MFIDLTPEQQGTLCLCCEDRPARHIDRSLGPVCTPCFVELLQVELALRRLWPSNPQHQEMAE